MPDQPVDELPDASLYEPDADDAALLREMLPSPERGDGPPSPWYRLLRRSWRRSRSAMSRSAAFTWLSVPDELKSHEMSCGSDAASAI